MQSMLILLLSLPYLIAAFWKKESSRGWVILCSSIQLALLIIVYSYTTYSQIKGSPVQDLYFFFLLVIPTLGFFFDGLRRINLSKFLNFVFGFLVGAYFFLVYVPPVRSLYHNYILTKAFTFSEIQSDKTTDLKMVELNGTIIPLPDGFNLQTEPKTNIKYLAFRDEVQDTTQAEIVIRPFVTSSLASLLIKVRERYRPSEVDFHKINSGYSFKLDGFSIQKTKNPLPLKTVVAAQNLFATEGISIVSWCNPQLKERCDEAINNIVSYLNNGEWAQTKTTKTASPTIERWYF